MKKPVFVIHVSLDECSFVNGPKESPFTREEFCIGQGGERIYGELYRPDDRKDCPVLIISHGFNGCSMDMRYEAECMGVPLERCFADTLPDFDVFEKAAAMQQTGGEERT